jgi:hypothetical protein
MRKEFRAYLLEPLVLRWANRCRSEIRAGKSPTDLITGFFLLEDVFALGDVIKVGERAGLVEAVSIRTVRLRDLAGTVHRIPFSAIETPSNMTKQFSFHVFSRSGLPTRRTSIK